MTDFKSTDWDFTLWLRVHDPEKLYEAAAAHPDCEDAAELKDIDGAVDINACLVILIDNPIPGCQIQSSGGRESYDP